MALERAGLLSDRDEELEVLVPWEWVGVAQVGVLLHCGLSGNSGTVA